jgi:SAM-dependent methyltransferase
MDFVAEAPAARRPHLEFLGQASASLAPGSRILDVGSGDAPYRELFADHEYLTCDWEATQYTPGRQPDYVAPANDLPLDDDSLDALVCTQVLEHVPDPATVMSEFWRVLRPGASLWLTTPLTWYLHELPHDYFRYTSAGLAHLATEAGFVEHEIQPMNSAPETIGQLLRHLGYLLGTHPDGHDPLRGQAARVANDLAAVVESFDSLDTQWWLPISYSLRTRKPRVAP